MLLILCSEQDPASVNIRDRLLELTDWEECGEFKGTTVHRRKCMVMITIPDMHIRADGIDDEVSKALGIEPDSMVVLSKHRAKSGIPTLTVHPIGNYHDAKAGGSPGTLVPSAPHLMTSLLRTLVRTGSGLGYDISFEVTHHGPSVRLPTVYVEIGSDEARWDDRAAGEALARMLLETRVEKGPVTIGVGGGHYAPRFTDICISNHISFGHMVPTYALEGDMERVLRLAIGSTPGAKMAYIHRKSMKRSQATAVRELLEAMDITVVTSKDLDDLGI